MYQTNNLPQTDLSSEKNKQYFSDINIQLFDENKI